MTVDDFRDLALRVLEGTADSDDRARCAAARGESAELAAEWDALRRAWETARAVAPALAAIPRPVAAAGATTPPPAPIDALLRRTVHASQSRSRATPWALGAVAAVAALVVGSFFFVELTAPRFRTAPQWTTRPWPMLVETLAVDVTRGAENGIVVLSPAVATASRTPTVAWTAEPGKSYTVTIAPAAEPERVLGRAEQVRAALDWAQFSGARELAPDTAYVVTVAETGRPLTATQRRFVTTTPVAPAAPPAGARALEAAFVSALCESSPARVGDAWLLWQQLPDESRNSPEGRRLHLVLVARLGWEAEFQRLSRTPAP